MSRDVFALDLTQVEALLPRYTTDAPRYTSYPTAPVWKEDYGPADFRTDLGDPDSAGAPLSLYVHIPFCESLCHFCACNRIITRDHSQAARYLELVEREIASVRACSAEPGLASQLHWGGGTPTYLDPAQIQRLHAALTAAFPLAEGAEVSIEVDPRVTTPEHVRALRACGFNRVSMGVQDFDARVQQAIHRIQSVDQTAGLVECARDEGFASVNFDLIYGLPFQTEASFSETLDRVCEMRPDRVALYSYAHVTWLQKQQRGFERTDLPDPTTRIRIMLASIRRFLDEGYVFIGLDHFALPEDELARSLRDRTLRRNFMGHTTQAETQLIGFGPSAISELRRSYAQSHRDLAGWQAAVEAGELATLRGHTLSREDVERRWIISRIVCHGELRADEFEAEFGHGLAPTYAKELESLEPALADGLLARTADGGFEVTPLGRLLVRNIATTFDAYLSEQRRAGQRIFSRTV